MTTDELIERCTHALNSNVPLELLDAEFEELTQEQALTVQQKFGARLMVRLPKREILFHEWLREADPPVWRDIWEGESEPAYTVSLSFLGELSGHGKGAFLICDLQTVDNYYFTPEMLLEKESSDFVDAVRTRFLAGGTLTPEQALTVEISSGGTDVWHFAYNRGVDLARAKKAVASLVDDRILVHVPKADHLNDFFGQD